MSQDAITALKLIDRAQRAARDPYEVMWDSRKPAKPVLPEYPAEDDVVGQCSWMTSVLHLNRSHPIIKALMQGLSRGLGHLIFVRYEAPSIRFEPASRLSSAQKAADELVWQLLPSDGDPYPWTAQQYIKIARVAKLLCGASRNASARDEIEVIVNTYLDAAERVELSNGGSLRERYETIQLLRPDIDPYGKVVRHRYVVDRDSGEITIRISDLAQVARKVTGSGLAYGWLDARMEEIGWRRRRLDGRGLPDGQGREPHGRVDVFKGSLSGVESGD